MISDCPLCGRDAHPYWSDEDGKRFWGVGCKHCPCELEMSFLSEEDAIKTWNKRTISLSVSAELYLNVRMESSYKDGERSDEIEEYSMPIKGKTPRMLFYSVFNMYTNCIIQITEKPLYAIKEHK